MTDSEKKLEQNGLEKDDWQRPSERSVEKANQEDQTKSDSPDKWKKKFAGEFFFFFFFFFLLLRTCSLRR